MSIGVQALNDADLAYLGRAHSVLEAERAINVATSLFDRVSIDLIYARHASQTAEMWREELEYAVKTFQLSHYSLYSLTLEPGTAFYRRHERGECTHASVCLLFASQLLKAQYPCQVRMTRQSSMTQRWP